MGPRKAVSTFSAQPRRPIPGSQRQRAGATPEKPASDRVTVSVIVRRKNPIDVRTLGKKRVTRAEYRRSYAADPADLRQVRAFAKEFGLTVEDTPNAALRRTVQLSGSAAAMQKAFAVELKQASIDGAVYRVREGEIRVPASLANVIVAVLGLDNRPQAKPHFRVRKDPSGVRPHTGDTGISYTPVQVAQLYNFPATGAVGQTIGIIELGGGYRSADLTAYFKSLGLPAPSVTAVSVDKGKNSPTSANSADGEVMLDIEVAAAVAPGAKIVVYFTPNTDQGFTDAISTAVHDTTNKPSVLSISWGGPESTWTQQSMTALDDACQSAAALGITITVAAGDSGSSDGVTDGANHVDFPASSPHVLACGGTKLVGSGSTISAETVWNEDASNEGATGGGVSTVFALPAWQAASRVPLTGSFAGRGVPDVAGDADPDTGYSVRVDGQTSVIGGTSAVAPLWAGLIALSNAQNKTTAGLMQPVLYTTQGEPAFNDITSGNNGAFSAGPGWDACTGLGSPVGTALIKLFATTSAGSSKKPVRGNKHGSKSQPKKNKPKPRK